MCDLLHHGPKSFKQLQGGFLNTILDFYKGYARSAVAIFIDSFDVSLMQLVRGMALGQDNRIWAEGQIGLLQAVWDINRMNPHIKVYASVRHEAIVGFSDEHSNAMENVYVVLQYSKRERAEILRLLVAQYTQKPTLEDFIGLAYISRTPRRTWSSASSWILTRPASRGSSR